LNSDNIFNIAFDSATVQMYCDRIIGRFYALLCIYEGRDAFTKVIVETREDAYKSYKKYLSNFSAEIVGCKQFFINNVNFITLLSMVEYMKLLDKNSHDKVRSSIFECINICKRMKGESE